MQLVEKQYGDITYLEKIPEAKYIEAVKAEETGYISSLDAEKCGQVSLELGAGRMTKEDEIDHLAGIILEKKIGDKVEKGDILAYIHVNKKEKIENAKKALQDAYKISKDEPNKYEHILGVI